MIFIRLAYNENHWIFPSGHPWSGYNQEQEDCLYQHQYGFAYEEWLFNTRYHVGGYQYGFIQGLQDYRAELALIERVYLYSVQHLEGGDLIFYIGYINDVELVGPEWRGHYPEAADIFDGYEPLVIREIIEINGDTAGLDAHGLYPAIRFKMDNVFMPDEPVLISQFPIDRYPGFFPYPLTEDIQQMFREAHGKR